MIVFSAGSPKKKLRLSRIKEIEQKYGPPVPNYNPLACRYIIAYGEKFGFDFQHAENGGEFFIKELGYWVDGYDAERNVVIEFDESHHFVTGELRESDVKRQKEIEFLGCEFIRINQNTYITCVRT